MDENTLKIDGFDFPSRTTRLYSMSLDEIERVSEKVPKKFKEVGFHEPRMRLYSGPRLKGLSLSHIKGRKSLNFRERLTQGYDSNEDPIGYGFYFRFPIFKVLSYDRKSTHARIDDIYCSVFLMGTQNFLSKSLYLQGMVRSLDDKILERGVGLLEEILRDSN